MCIEPGLALARILLCVCAFAASVGPGLAGSDALTRHRQVSRVLVLSTPDAGDRRLAEQRAALAAVRSDLDERDLVVLEAIGAGREAEAIRRQLRLPSDAFRAVLVGKDGGAKITAAEPIPVERLFTTIDAMPMRRDEMRQRR